MSAESPVRLLGALSLQAQTVSEKIHRNAGLPPLPAWANAAAILAHLDDPLGSCLLRVKWGGQESQRRHLVEKTWSRLKQSGLVWEEKKSRRLATLALNEVVHNGFACSQCHGRGLILMREPAKLCRACGRVMDPPEETCWYCDGPWRVFVVERRRTCRTCQGRGVRPALSGRQCAHYLGVAESNWRRTWAQRYRMVLGVLLNCEVRALQQVIRETKGA
ncbi:MAG: hypothetical protein HQL56_18350 [Magnetococcales bacterium]|nr:hypothetical protein [Magnetococcales bacterium]